MPVRRVSQTTGSSSVLQVPCRRDTSNTRTLNPASLMSDMVVSVQSEVGDVGVSEVSEAQRETNGREKEAGDVEAASPAELMMLGA